MHVNVLMSLLQVDASGKVKLTNISPEKRVNLQPEVKDGRVCLSKYIHIKPEFFQNRDEVKYKVKDDMYGVGIIMWEMWEGHPVVELGKEYEIPESYMKGVASKEKNDWEDDDDEQVDEFWFQKYLKTFLPKKTEHFTDQTNKKRSHLCEEWWRVINMCLNESITAKQWLEKWNDYPNFPEVSIVFQDKHYNHK